MYKQCQNIIIWYFIEKMYCPSTRVKPRNKEWFHGTHSKGLTSLQNWCALVATAVNLMLNSSFYIGGWVTNFCSWLILRSRGTILKEWHILSSYLNLSIPESDNKILDLKPEPDIVTGWIFGWSWVEFIYKM